MFTVHIDDSGTDPNQAVAIASGLIVPGARILSLAADWNRLKIKEGFSCWHTSECLANWAEPKRSRVFRRVRALAKRYGVKAISFAIYKKDYDEVVPLELRQYSGNFHYSWAIRHLLAASASWRLSNNVPYPLEYVFDWMERKNQRRIEVEDVIAQQQEAIKAVGWAEGELRNYSFRSLEDIPGLQCADAVAWTSYQYALFAFRKKPLTAIAEEAWEDFRAHPKADWLDPLFIKKSELERWVKNRQAVAYTKEWFSAWRAKKASAGKRT